MPAGNVRFALGGDNLACAAGAAILNGAAVTVASQTCVSGLSLITRVTAGSYITDQVKRWSLLSNTIAARFPANTRITAVTATVLSTSAPASSSTGGGEAATYTPLQALSEDPQFPATNLQVNDRAVFYRTLNALTGAYTLEWDLSPSGTPTDYPIALVGLHGIRKAAGSALPGFVSFSTRTAAQGYITGAWTPLVTNLPVSGRDVARELAGPTMARFIRAAFDNMGGGFQFSTPYFGLIRHDLGRDWNVVYSPGARYVDTERAARTETLSGLEFLRVLGDEGMLLSLPYTSIETPLAAVIRTLARETLPITHLSAFDDVMQVRRSGPDFTRDHQWRNDVGDDQLDMTLELRKLA